MLKDALVEQISELPLSVNIIAREEKLIQKAQTNHFWATISEDSFDELAQKLASLMKFRANITDPGQEKLNLQDIIKTKEMIEFGPDHEAISIAKYKKMVEEKILALTSNNPVLQKLKEGREISINEAELLAEELHNEHPHITVELLRRIYQNQKAHFVQLIKHILGIEILESFPETVSKSIDLFYMKHPSYPISTGSSDSTGFVCIYALS